MKREIAHGFILMAIAFSLLFIPVRSSASGLEFGANLRHTSALANGVISPTGKDEYDATHHTQARLTARMKFNGNSYLNIHVVQAIDHRPPETSVPGIASGNDSRYHAGSGSWIFIEENDITGRLYHDRLNISSSYNSLDITAGRQAINFSHAYFWNPLDTFAPFAAASFDRDYKPGVDALRLDYAVGSFSSLCLVASAGKELFLRAPAGTIDSRDLADESWYGSALLARYTTSIESTYISVQAGKIYGGFQLGLGISGEFRGMGIHAETSTTRSSHERTLVFSDSRNIRREEDVIENHFALVTGIDYRFSNDLYVNCEYFYNGEGEPERLFVSAARMMHGEGQSMSRHLAGVQLVHDILPLVETSLSAIISLDDHSNLVSPGVSFSVSDESELVAGAILSGGTRASRTQAVSFSQNRYPGTISIPEPLSEFGSVPDFYYIEFKIYF